MNRATEEKSYEKLSPFELKDKLIAMTENESEKLMLMREGGIPTGWPLCSGMHSFCWEILQWKKPIV